jgi:membrane protease YdiL (CAAX protease family)
MSAQIAGLNKNETVASANWGQRLGLFVVFLICSVAIFVFGSNYFAVFPTNKNLAYSAVLSAAFLVAAVCLKRSERFAKYWQVAFALFIAAFAFLFALLFAGWSSTVLGWFNLTINTSQGIAFAKVYEMLMIVVPIIVLTKLSGADLGAIYLRRGNLKWGLSIGALVFFNFASSALLFFATRYTSTDKLGAAVLWGIVFSFANSFMEELWLRGIFLKRFEPLLGTSVSILLTSIVFSLMHIGAVYLTPAAIPFLLANALTLGLACGFLMMKTDSIWGAVLIHAAADLFAFMAIFANA